MTALLDERLRELATQTHLLEKKVILRKGMLPFHWIAESHVYPDKGYVTAVRERTNYGAVWALSSRGALDQVMLSIWEDIEWLDERMD